MPFVIGEQVGAYRITEQLGQGGMSTVYKAYHAALDRHVALKVLHPVFKGDQGFMVRFQREARIVARLEHPHIVPVYDFSEHEGTPFLVMRYIEGRTLKVVLSEQGPMSVERIIEILRPVCEALEYAHGLGVLHRDVKPSNILLSREGKIYVTDFGLAKMAESGDSTISQDRMIGTPQYISPEQAKGETLDHRTDLYSLGVVLFEMVTGRVPYTADTPFAVVHDHIFSPLPLPSTLNPAIPPTVEQVVLKALAKSPDDRYADAGEFLRALIRAAEGLAQEAMLVQGAVPPAAGSAVTTPIPPVVFPTPESAATTTGPPPESAATIPVPTIAPASEVTATTPVPTPVSTLDRAVETPPPLPVSPQADTAVASPSAVDSGVAAIPSRPRRWPAWKFGVLGGGLALVAIVTLVLIHLLRRGVASPSKPEFVPPPPAPQMGDIPAGIEVFPIFVEEGYDRLRSIPPEEAERMLADLWEAIDEDPENPFLYLDVGNLLYRLGAWEEAAGVYYQAYELEPGLVEAHYNKGVVLIYLREPEEAVHEFSMVLEMLGGDVDPPVYYNLGLAHALLGNRREAIAALREFLRRWPEEDTWRKWATEVLRSWGEKE